MAIKRDKLKKQRNESTNSGAPPPSISNIMNNMIGDTDQKLPLTNALAKRDKSAIVAGKFTMTMTGLQIEGEISSDEWLEFAGWIAKLQDSIQWILGDLLNYAAQRLDKWIESDAPQESKYKLFLEQTDYSYSSLRKFASIAGRISPERRFNELSYSHHVEVVDLEEDEQQKYLKLAYNESWSVRELREEINGKPKKVSPLDQIIDKSSSTYEFAQKNAKRAKGREKTKWINFIQDETERWQKLLEELES